MICVRMARAAGPTLTTESTGVSRAPPRQGRKGETDGVPEGRQQDHV